MWGNWIDELLTSDLGAEPERYYFCENAIGSVCQATDEEGLVVEEYLYPDIYGIVQVYSCEDEGASRTRSAVSGSGIGNRHLFQGREWDFESQIYHVRFRWMDSQSGRFSTRDPIGKHGDVLTNEYSFTTNDPVNLHDPLGLSGGSFELGELFQRWRDIAKKHLHPRFLVSAWGDYLCNLALEGIRDLADKIQKARGAASAADWTDLIKDMEDRYDFVVRLFNTRGCTPPAAPPPGVGDLDLRLPSDFTFTDDPPPKLVNPLGGYILIGIGVIVTVVTIIDLAPGDECVGPAIIRVGVALSGA